MDNTASKLINAGKQHPDIVRARALLKKDGAAEGNVTAVEGLSVITEMMAARVEAQYFIVCREMIFSPQAHALLEQLACSGRPVYDVSEKVFALLAEKGTSGGFIAVLNMPLRSLDELSQEENGTYLVLDGLELPGNVGTLLRTADASKISGVIITSPRTQVHNPKVLRASRGACFNVPIACSTPEEVSRFAQERGLTVFLADTASAECYTNCDFSRGAIFVLGCERYGIDRSWYSLPHRALFIPMLGKCDSLNVGVAGSVLAYEALRQRTK